jgi:hypothetical protein
MQLHRYWLKFDLTIHEPHPIGTLLGCGVTAYFLEDARQLVRELVFGSIPFPSISWRIEDVDVSSLDPGHILPNMGDPSRRGVWFPLGCDSIPLCPTQRT